MDSQLQAYFVTLDFQLLFHALPGLYLALTPDLRIVAATDTYLFATKTDRDQILGRYVFDVFPENPLDGAMHSQKGLLASFHKVLETHQFDALPIFRYDIRNLKSGNGQFEEHYWSVANYPLLDKNGNLLCIINHVEDVTDLIALSDHNKQSQAHDFVPLHTNVMETELFTHLRELDLANQQLRQANADLETFAWTVSHDFQAPLRHIRSFAQFLSAEYAEKIDDTGRDYLNTIIESGTLLSTLIDDLIEYNRVSRKELLFETLSLPAIITTVVRQINGSVRKLRIDIPATIPSVVAHRITLILVLLNLVWNATKFVKPGLKPELTIAAEQMGSRVRLWVRDRGIGILPEHLQRIFEPFQRLNSKDDYPGNGIGLAIVKRGVERMNGRMGVQSTIGEGSSFWIELPAAQEI